MTIHLVLVHALLEAYHLHQYLLLYQAHHPPQSQNSS
nr:MAG TPA: hypothetical protein [Caudoviricetes sp.]